MQVPWDYIVGCIGYCISLCWLDFGDVAALVTNGCDLVVVFTSYKKVKGLASQASLFTKTRGSTREVEEYKYSNFIMSLSICHFWLKFSILCLILFLIPSTFKWSFPTLRYLYFSLALHSPLTWGWFSGQGLYVTYL